MFTNNVPYKKDRILRVIVDHINGGYSTGSGFFINDKGQLLTCFHVIFGQELSKIKQSDQYKIISGNNEKEKLDNWFKQLVKMISVELPDKRMAELKLEKYNQKYDIVLLNLVEENFVSSVKYCTLDFNAKVKYGDQIFFGGFPISYPYDAKETPFAINTGIVSSFPETVIGGEKYKHIQINSINLGGNSGAPLFRKNSNKVIGIINGNMRWGSEKAAFINDKGQPYKDSFQVPLSIAYATALNLIKEQTNIFD